MKDFGFVIYQEVDGQEWWINKDGGDKKGFDLEKLQIMNNVDRYAAHIYVKQGSDDIYYSNPNKEVSEFSTVTVHYNRTDKDYTGWNLWTWATGVADGRIDFEYEDDFGYLAEFQVKTGNTLGYLVRKSETGNDWADKNFDADQQLVIHGDTEIWIEQGQNGFHSLSPNGQTGDRVELPEAPSDDLVSDEEADMQVFVHYFRYLEDYRNWNTWAWADGVVEGHGYSFTKSDEFGRIAKINLKDIEGLEKLGFIIRRGEWSEKDVDMDRFFDLTKAKHNPETDKLELNVYLLQDDPNVYYSAEEIDKTPPLKTATFNKTTQLIIKAPIPFEDKDGVLLENSEGNAVPIISSELSKDKRTIMVTLENEIEIGETYYVSKTGFRGNLYVEYYGMFDSQEFHDKFTYTGNDLGATFTKAKTNFRVWAPTASNVSLRLYQDGHTDSLIKEVEMTKDVNGTWIATEKGNLHKTYYTYVVTVGNQTNEAVDPYSRAVGVNGQRAMVVNLDATDPSGWESDKNPEFSGNITDAIIYELHLRDLSSSSTSGISNVGKFLQLTEKGTKSDKGVATGLDHLVEMGITHLHLLPAFDHRSIDETKLETPQFNWGYDPQNYNVPEGSYSTDPYNGEVRVNEFKQMVQSLHENDINVVMDVVYNHT
ncbi:MAG: pullulanase-associated domain-containing protein, partial [Turicibacter sp.]